MCVCVCDAQNQRDLLYCFKNKGAIYIPSVEQQTIFLAKNIINYSTQIKKYSKVSLIMNKNNVIFQYNFDKIFIL